MIGAIRFEGFPALSEDGSEIAILRRDDGMNYSASLVVLRRSDQSVLQRFQLLDETQGEVANDAGAVAKLEAAIAPPNAYLASGGFVPMERLYTLPADSIPPPIQEFVSAGRRFAFNRRSGELTIHAQRTNDEILRVKRPRLVQTAQGMHPHNACILDAVPSQGWIDAGAKFVVVRIDYVSSKDGCYEPEHWVLEALP